MTKWKQLETKITEDELKHIQKYMKKRKIKSLSKFLRQAIENMIGVSLADATINKATLPQEYLTVYNFAEKLKLEFGNSPKSQKTIDEFFNKWRSKYLIQWSNKENKKLSLANKLWPAFKEHQKIGRKKNPKRSRGNPGNRGLDG